MHIIAFAFSTWDECMKFSKLALGVFSTLIGFGAYATDISGTWQQIDDQSGTPKAFIEIRKEINNTYTGTIIKITPRPGYEPRKRCVRCPLPFTNKAILGMDVLKGLVQQQQGLYYEKGEIIDPLSGKVYFAKVKMNASGSRLTLKAYEGTSTLGRSQTWIRKD